VCARSPIFITLMQISQMFVGVGITVANYHYQVRQPPQSIS
jgi:hypothetical protein